MPRLVLFARVPQPGVSKTRLIPALGPDGAASLYRALLSDLLGWATRLRGVMLEVLLSPPGTPPDALRASLLTRASAPLSPRLSITSQASGDLGARLEAGLHGALGQGPCAVAIGSDCPLLGPAMIREALRRLQRVDCVVGPAHDGGYYLLGLRRPAPAIFRAVPWSTPRVLAATLERARRSRLEVSLLPPLGDVDEACDLPALEAALWARWALGPTPAFPLWTLRALEEIRLRRPGVLPPAPLHPGESSLSGGEAVAP